MRLKLWILLFVFISFGVSAMLDEGLQPLVRKEQNAPSSRLTLTLKSKISEESEKKLQSTLSNPKLKTVNCLIIEFEDGSQSAPHFFERFFEKMPKLNTLKLEGSDRKNSLETELKEIVDFFLQHPKEGQKPPYIYFLTLTNTLLDREVMGLLEKWLTYRPSLLHLSLTNNQISPDGIGAHNLWTPLMKKSSALTRLDLSENTGDMDYLIQGIGLLSQRDLPLEFVGLKGARFKRDSTSLIFTPNRILELDISDTNLNLETLLTILRQGKGTMRSLSLRMKRGFYPQDLAEAAQAYGIETLHMTPKPPLRRPLSDKQLRGLPAPTGRGASSSNFDQIGSIVVEESTSSQN